MTVKRAVDFSALEKAVLKETWIKIKNTPKDGQERSFKGVFIWGGARYHITCDFLLSSDFLTLTKFDIMHNGKRISTQDKIILADTVYKEIYLN